MAEFVEKQDIQPFKHYGFSFRNGLQPLDYALAAG